MSSAFWLRRCCEKPVSSGTQSVAVTIAKAIEIVQKAIEHDQAQNHRQACKEYMDALDYFMLALKYEKNEQFKLLIRSKIDDYLGRAEALQKHLSAPTGTIQANGIGAAQAKRTDGEDPETTKLRAGLAEAILGSAGSDVTWDDIAGLDAAKTSLKEAVIIPLKFPQLFTGSRKPWKGILLYGPPGTGKSYLAKAVATEAKSTFFSISSSDLVSKWQGDSEKLVRHLFQMAREMRPAIIFIDEIDSMTGARGDGDSDASRRLKTEFLVQMDGVGHDDTGVLTASRFQKRIYIPLPGLDARQRMFELHVGQMPCELTRQDYHSLAEKTEGYSGADVQIVVQDALMQPIRKLIAATHFKPVPTADGPVKWMSCSPGDAEAVEKAWSDLAPDELFEPKITLKDFTTALENVRPSVVEADIARHVLWTKDFGSDGS
ncbi:P-loop containing nucleoside triphosphate hydrolase protein [Mycena albidolilacea]|uniref:vesicle-fusing ATPase n=1 Tax=Mycena albidolilacea TaxID=1033008 RepID=A0AAD7EYK0_9AGAR|nr:P-loop containing nucleoside triphosphate hydrolase protein [Mycena albidolilacea]